VCRLRLFSSKPSLSIARGPAISLARRALLIALRAPYIVITRIQNRCDSEMIIAFNSAIETVTIAHYRQVYFTRATASANRGECCYAILPSRPPPSDPPGALIGSPSEIPFPLASPAPFSFFISPCLVADHRGNPVLELTPGECER